MIVSVLSRTLGNLIFFDIFRVAGLSKDTFSQKFVFSEIKIVARCASHFIQTKMTIKFSRLAIRQRKLSEIMPTLNYFTIY